MTFLSPENMILILRTENERWHFSKKYMEMVAFPFHLNMKLPFCQKSKDDLSPKNTSKDDISGITEKDDVHLGKDDIGILCTFMETFLSVFIYCFLIKNAKKLNL